MPNLKEMHLALIVACHGSLASLNRGNGFLRVHVHSTLGFILRSRAFNMRNRLLLVLFILWHLILWSYYSCFLRLHYSSAVGEGAFLLVPCLHHRNSLFLLLFRSTYSPEGMGHSLTLHSGFWSNTLPIFRRNFIVHYKTLVPSIHFPPHTHLNFNKNTFPKDSVFHLDKRFRLSPDVARTF